MDEPRDSLRAPVLKQKMDMKEEKMLWEVVEKEEREKPFPEAKHFPLSYHLIAKPQCKVGDIPILHMRKKRPN